MICKNCRNIVDDSTKICPNCGSNIESQNEVSNDNYSKLANANTNRELLNNLNGNKDVSNKISFNNKVFIITIAIISLVILIAAICYFLKSKNNTNNSDSNSNITSNSNSNVESNSNNTSNSNNNSTSNGNENNSDVITFKGYTLYVPNTYKVSSSADTLQLIGKNNKDIAVINISNGSYDDIKASPKALEDYVKNRQIVCNNIKTTYYNGVEFTTAEIISNGSKMILGYSKIDKNHVFEIVISNISSVIDYSEFDTFADVAKTIKAA